MNKLKKLYPKIVKLNFDDVSNVCEGNFIGAEHVLDENDIKYVTNNYYIDDVHCIVRKIYEIDLVNKTIMIFVDIFVLERGVIDE